MTAGRKIKMILAQRDMKQKDLAELLGITPGTLSSKIKSDNFSEKDLIKIAKVLGYDYEAVFTDKETGKTV